MIDECDWRKPNSWQRRYWGDLVDDPSFRLKALGPVDLERRVKACQEALGAACPAYERTPPMPPTRTKDKGMTIYETLSRDLDAVESHVMDLYVEARDAEALEAAAALKSYLVRYKATPATHPGDVALGAACDTHGDNKIVALLQRAALASPVQLDQALQLLGGAQPLKPTATVTDSGKMSVQKSYDPSRDPFATLMHADQTKGNTR